MGELVEVVSVFGQVESAGDGQSGHRHKNSIRDVYLILPALDLVHFPAVTSPVE